MEPVAYRFCRGKNMVGRIKSERSELAVNFSGPLGARLEWYARERMAYLFSFEFAVEGAYDRFKTLGGTTLRHNQLIQEKATHQIGTGFRSEHPEHDEFDETDKTMAFKSATAFSNTDAAHFCNLGLTYGWSSVKKNNDKAIQSLVELAEVFAGATTDLPQRINIGPDRIIDQFHWAFSKILFSKRPLLSLGLFLDYAKGAAHDMNVYKVEMLAKGSFGLAACCDYYLTAYSNLDTINGCYRSTTNQLSAECDALGLDRKIYIT
jgi:hypothetical protein